ncbi:MAG TPA: hypothetical protein VJT73_15550 [Polyangiaceae bacterium]|nr:hypothetical protein [Polyangiaceae bacterium]
MPSSEVLAIAESPGSPRLRRALTFVGGCYVVAMFLEGVQPWLHRYLPQSLVFFCQISALFPRAASHSIEYRAQGYTCSDKVIEIDVRPFFPIHADDKESRFERAMFFYRNDKTVMEALEAYVMREYNRAEPDKIAGVSFMSLRLPIPPPGTTFPRYERKALVDYPSERRKVWYFTPHDTVALRCRSGGL